MTLGLFDAALIGGLQPASTMLLDVYTNAAAAYSLRQLRTGVTNVARIYRSLDNTESDFTAAQITDGTLAAWLGISAGGFITTWYDQSGNGRHAFQSTPGNRPRIATSGVVNLVNQKPALAFDGSATHLNLPTIAFSMNALCVNVVCKADATNSRIGFSSPDPNRLYVPFLNSGVYYVGYGASATTFNFGSSNATSQYVVQISAGVSTVNAWRNGAASTAVASSSAAETGSFISIGSYMSSNGVSVSSYWQGSIQELIFYASNQTANQPGIASNVNAYYAIY